MGQAGAPSEYGMHKFVIPASLAGGAAGHFAGSPFGPVGSKVGMAIGAAAPFVSGAAEGVAGEEALGPVAARIFGGNYTFPLPKSPIETFAPMRPNPVIARNLRSGGLPEESAQAFGPPIRRAGMAALDQPPIVIPKSSMAAPPPRPYTGPNRVNPAIAKRMKFTPGGENEFTGSSGDQPHATLGTRAEMMRQRRLKAKSLEEAGK